MPDTINIAGKPVNKYAAYAVGGTLVVGGIAYARKQKAAKANAAAITQAGSTETDPATGYPYGSPEDAAALAAQGQYNTGVLGSGYGGGSGFVGGNPSGIFTGQGPGAFPDNASWAQYAEAYEVDNMGADAPTVGNAVGKYLTGQPLTTDAMVSIIQSAIAIAGYPPVAGTNGDPPGYITSSTTPVPNPTPTPTPTPTPKPTGDPSAQTGTVHSSTTGRSGQVNTTNGGKTWNYVGVKSHQPEPANQTGTVNSATTGKTGKVKTSNGGLQWQFVGA